jgi:putative membrane protein
MPSDEPTGGPTEEATAQDSHKDSRRERAPSEPPPRGRANDYLANERTFLAWVRTSLALVGLGFVVARFGLFLREAASRAGTAGTTVRVGFFSQGFGVALVVMAAALLVASYLRYRQTAHALDHGMYTDDRTLIGVLAGVTVAAALALGLYLVLSA